MKKTRTSAAGAIFCALTAATAAAHASSGADTPENGIVQMGRGSAWVARADDPLAVYYNPAAIAFQPTSIHVGSTFMFQDRCFTRLGPNGQPVAPNASLPAPGTAGGPAGEVCAAGTISPNPQGAATFRITQRFAIGVAVLGPHAVGGNEWPESVPYTNSFGFEATQPSPQRYLLVSSDAIIVKPTVSVAFAPLDNLSFGAGFIWGVASARFINFSETLSPAQTGQPTDNFFINGDIKGQLDISDYFIPGFVLGALWSPSEYVDVGAWFMWMDGVNAPGDIHLESTYFNEDGSPNRNLVRCRDSTKEQLNCNFTDREGVARLKFAIPMEAKIGTRFRVPRRGVVPKKGMRDPMSHDLFDIELDFTWAHNSAVNEFELSFPGGANRIPVNGTGGLIPPNANVPRRWKDVIGIHLGGDFVAIQDRLSIRGGAWFETKGQDDEYLALDFNLAQKFGLALGATVRVGPVDLSTAYQHTFIGTLDNGGRGAVKALSGDAGADFRSRQIVNGGVLKSSLNEFGLSGTVRF